MCWASIRHWNFKADKIPVFKELRVKTSCSCTCLSRYSSQKVKWCSLYEKALGKVKMKITDGPNHTTPRQLSKGSENTHLNLHRFHSSISHCSQNIESTSIIDSWIRKLWSIIYLVEYYSTIKKMMLGTIVEFFGPGEGAVTLHIETMTTIGTIGNHLCRLK